MRLISWQTCQRAAWLIFLVLLLTLLVSCAGKSNQSSKPTVEWSPTPGLGLRETPEAPTPTLVSSPAVMSVTDTAPVTPTAGENPILPARDRTPNADSGEMARQVLAARIKVSPDQIKIVLQGEWSTDPISCPVDADLGQVSKEHRRVALEYKGRTYEVWIFRTADGTQWGSTCTGMK